MMSHCAIQQKNAYACYGDVGRDYVVCPKPRRAGHTSTRPAGWHMSNQADMHDSDAGNELLDIILSKGGGQDRDQTYSLVPSSPPFFSGSPPSRVSNPLIQDARFVEEQDHASITCSAHFQHPNFPILNSGSSSVKKGGFVRANFGNNPVARVEGFKALNKDGRNCGITALA
ncbi:unnamed protein product [Rhodiola kirilowii]